MISAPRLIAFDQIRTVTLSLATREPKHDTIDLPLTNGGTIPFK